MVADREGVLLPVILELVLKRNTKGISFWLQVVDSYCVLLVARSPASYLGIGFEKKNVSSIFDLWLTG